MHGHVNVKLQNTLLCDDVKFRPTIWGAHL